MTNLDSIFKSRDITLPTKVRLVKKRLWCWEGLGAGGEGDARRWDGWMASLTRWMWVWVNSGSWWWIERPGVLWFMGSPILLIWTPRRGPGKPGIQVLSEPSQDTAQWILLEVNLGLPFFSAEPCWCLILGISRWKNVELDMEPRILCHDYDSVENNFSSKEKLWWFSWEIGSGKSQRFRAPGLSSLTLKKGYFGLASQACKVFLVCLYVKFDSCMLYMTLILRQGQENY